MAAAERNYSETVKAGGTAVVEITPSDGISTWTLQQITTEMPTAPVGSTGFVRKNGGAGLPFIATGDTLDGDPPILARPGDRVTVEWAGCTPGDVARVFVMFDDGRPE